MVTDARPVRTPPSSRRTCSICASMRFFTSPNSPLRSLTSITVSVEWPMTRAGGSRSRSDRRPDRIAHDHAAQVAAGAEVEHDDRQFVVHAQRDRGGVHHLESLLE